MTKHSIEISLAKQTLVFLEDQTIVANFGISSATNGPGEQMDSECTPRGRHVIEQKIGAGCVKNTVFIGRRASGEIYDPALREQFPERDWIVTRILWLRGIEAGRNSGGKVDSQARYIYIHGTPEDTDMSTPGSRGCVRMANGDIERLFDLVDEGTPVNITEA